MGRKWWEVRGRGGGKGEGVRGVMWRIRGCKG